MSFFSPRSLQYDTLIFLGLFTKPLIPGIERHPSQNPSVSSVRGVMTGLITTLCGKGVSLPYLGLSSGTSTMQILREMPTCGAAMPRPFAACIVSFRSLMMDCTCYDWISAISTSLATWRSTGFPILIIGSTGMKFNEQQVSSSLHIIKNHSLTCSSKIFCTYLV